MGKVSLRREVFMIAHSLVTLERSRSCDQRKNAYYLRLMNYRRTVA